MIEIQKIGGYLEIDKDGFIIKKASADKFQEKWKPVIKEIKNAYIEHFGDKLHSVYIRGSVAKGEAIDGIADLDSIAVVNLPNEQIDIKWKEELNKQIIDKYPFIKNVEIVAGTLEHALSKNRGVHIILKTQAVCIYGNDISDSITKLKPGKESALHFRNLQDELQKTIDFFENGWGDTLEENLDKCSWIMKRVLRTGFELVMEREQKYTRDLYPCYEGFVKYYPEKKDEIYKTLELAVNPTDDSKIIIPLLKDWLIFMPKEIEKFFGFK